MDTLLSLVEKHIKTLNSEYHGWDSCLRMAPSWGNFKPKPLVRRGAVSLWQDYLGPWVDHSDGWNIKWSIHNFSWQAPFYLHGGSESFGISSHKSGSARRYSQYHINHCHLLQRFLQKVNIYIWPRLMVIIIMFQLDQWAPVPPGSRGPG